MAGITFDPEKFQLTIARLKKAGHVFEIVVDPDLALAYRDGGKMDVLDILQAPGIFLDAQKGLHASSVVMEEVFLSDDKAVVAQIILKQGEIHLTTAYKKKLREQKHKQIVARIHKYGIDPRTKAPHPMERIERAMEQGKIKIDEHKAVDEQVKDIVKKLQPIIPISFEKKVIELHIGASFAHKAYGIVKGLAQIEKEQWLGNGDWMGVAVIPAGLEQDLYEKLNSATHGSVESRLLETRKM